jgi:hypothetical protein
MIPLCEESMFDPLNGDELRLWAAHCETKAKQAIWSRAEREGLLRMRESLLALADTADWLGGRSRDLAMQAAAE